MNFKVIFQTIGKAVKVEAALLLLPACIALGYHEACSISLFITAVIALVTGCFFSYVSRDCKEATYERDSFVMVTLVWVIMSFIGAIPFRISGEIPSYVDALFETVSGFTTTGASILTDIEALSHGLLFWRSLTHWIGGMGILVFIVMLGNKVQGRSMSVLKAEMPGPVIGKLVPRARDTAKYLYIIYIALTFLEVIILRLGNMPLFDAAVNTMSTAGTGGFAIHNDSLQSISPFCQWVIAIFMLLFGVNFNLYFFIVIGNAKQSLKNEELRWYINLILVAVAIVSADIYVICKSGGETIRLAFFQVVSLITTTGFSTCNYDLWPSVAKTTLLVLMFIGGCAGSTAGGLKVSRLMIICKSIRQEITRLIQPRRVCTISIDKKVIGQEIVRETNVYFAFYALFLSASSLLLMVIEPVDLVTGFSAVTACFSNVGPGFGTIGPSGNFSQFTDFTKVLLSFTMITGRLEIYPVLTTIILPFAKK